MVHSFEGRSFFGSITVYSRLLAGALAIAAILFCGSGYGWTCAGSEAETNSTGNYPLGMPMGGIGGGNYNFLPSGLYNTTYVRVTADAGAPARCIAYQNRSGATAFSDSLVNAGAMTTTFTGFWPTVDMTYYQAGMLDSISLECFSPIIAGAGIANDNMYSSLPLAVYIFTITNNSASYDTTAIALSNGATTTVLNDPVRTWRVVGIQSATVCVMVDTAKSDPADSITCGNTRATFMAGGMLNNGSAGILAKRIVLKPNSSRTISFAVSWTNVTGGYYQNYFTTAQGLANYGRDSAAILDALVNNWHNKILKSNIPAWLSDLAINSLHVYNCMTDYTTATTNGVAGTYGMAESMSSGNYGTNDQAYHAHFALSCFAPQAEWSQVARMAGCQLSSGLFPHLYTGDNSLRTDEGQKFIMETYKVYQWTGNTSYLTALYPNIKKAIAGIQTLNTRTTDGLTDDSDMTTFDNPYTDGWSIPSKEYEDEWYEASLKAASKAAVASGSPADTAAYIGRYDTVYASFERATNTTYANSGFWDSTTSTASGRLGHYTASTNINVATGKAIWDEAFSGQWSSDVCGLGPLHPESRIESSLLSIYDACLDHTNPPAYTLMMAYPNVNCTGTSPSGVFFNGNNAPSTTPIYVTYLTYGPADLCAAFGHNDPDVAMRGLQAMWNTMFSKYLRVFNMPCKEAIAGNGTDWGQDRYMNSPAAFAALYGITGFSIDVNAKLLRIKPSLPDSSQYKMDSLKSGPLINPISCGTVDYRSDTTVTPHVQRFVVKFDNPMLFNTFYTKKMFAQAVAVRKPAVGGGTVAATIAVNSADTSEYVVTFGSTLTIDSTGVLIVVGTNTVGVLSPTSAKRASVNLMVDTKRGIISYTLLQREQVTLCLTNARGERILYFKGQGNAGSNEVRYDWKNRAAGIYYAQLAAGGAGNVKKIIFMK